MATDAKILIVEDEDDLRKVLEFNLKNEGYETIAVATGKEGLENTDGVDLILLDLMLPDIQGTDVCRALKSDAATQNIPVVFLTARGEEIDRVVGFEVGAEDYVVKPFSVRELLLRIKAILKRSRVSSDEEIEFMVFGEIKIDPDRHRVFIDGQEVELTATEFRLISRFINKRGKVQTREKLLSKVWGSDVNVTERTVDTHVKRLREKLGKYGSYIETVRGVGYRFAETP